MTKIWPNRESGLLSTLAWLIEEPVRIEGTVFFQSSPRRAWQNLADRASTFCRFLLGLLWKKHRAFYSNRFFYQAGESRSKVGDGDIAKNGPSKMDVGMYLMQKDIKILTCYRPLLRCFLANLLQCQVSLKKHFQKAIRSEVKGFTVSIILLRTIYWFMNKHVLHDNLMHIKFG